MKDPLIEINLTKCFLFAELEHYKIQFSETSNNDYLDIMNKFNKAINLLDKLVIVANKSYQSEMRTKREMEEMQKLSEHNNKLSWFLIPNDFEVSSNKKFTKGWYKIIGTFLKSGSIEIKKKDGKDIYTITDLEYRKIITTFEEVNKHLDQ